MPAGKYEGDAFSRGDVMRRLADLERQITALTTSRRLEAATIGQGGIRVRGGEINIEDAAGTETLTLSSSHLELIGQLDVTGSIIAVGEIRSTTEDGNYARLNQGQIFMSRGLAGELSGTVFAGDAGDATPSLQILPPAEVRDSTRFILTGGTAADPTGNAFLFSDGPVQIDSGASSLFLDGALVFLRSPTGEVAAHMANTTSAANVHIDGTDETIAWLIRRVTSSAAYKLDVDDLEVDVAEVLALRPRVWRDRGEVEQDPDTDRWHVGLVAEEVHEAGLTEFVDYDEDGLPVSVTYDRLVVALLEVIRQQQARLDALDGGGPQRRGQPRQRRPQRRAVARPPDQSPPQPPARDRRREGRSAG